MMELPLNEVLIGDVLKKLKLLPDNSIHCIVTSPPYWGLRDYGMIGQIGLENTPKKFISKLVKVFKECRRVLRDDGTLWLNMGDSYAHNGAAYGSEKSTLVGRKQGEEMGAEKRFVKKGNNLKPKDLVGIPWMLAFALRDAGWYLRADIIWSKPNAMPESVSDRPTKAHEYIFLLSKSPKYYYDAEAIKTLAKYAGITGMDATGYKDAKTFNGKHSDKQRGHYRRHAGFNERWDNMTTSEQMSMGANKRSVWEVPTKPFAGAHFATFPPDLIVDCIKAGYPENGIVLDPFFGAGTTGLVARKLNRNFIGIELNPKYAALATKRINSEMGLFK